MFYYLENKKLKIIIDSLGAELQNITDKNRRTEYLWQGDSKYWARRAPILFPIVGKLDANRFEYQGLNYSLPQHGFARDQEFKLIKNTEQTITLQLEADTKTKINYPFDFILKINYTLKNTELLITYTIKNPAETDLYFSIGSHEAFRCPLGEHLSLKNYALLFSKDKKLERTFLIDGLQSKRQEIIELKNNLLNLDETLFQTDALIFKNLKSREVCLFENRAPKIAFTFEDFPYFAIWKKPEANFLCLEAWAGIADSPKDTTSPEGAGGRLTKKEGIIHLAAGATKIFQHKISFLL